MVLDTITTEEKLLNFNHPKTYTYLSLGIGMVAVIILMINNEYFEIDFIENFFFLFAIISFIVFAFSQFITLFSKEDILIKKTGKLKITSDEFIIDNDPINFKEILSLEINFDDYEGRVRNHHSNTEPMYSKGADNYLKVKTIHKKVEKQILLQSLREMNLVYDFLSSQIVKNKFKKVNLRQLIAIFRDDFKKTDEARNYIAALIIEKKLNTTEGLLMMNYSSDKEAKELRKKYLI
jgi:hypothetical protein